MIAYKALAAGDVITGAASLKAASQGSGAFTFWNDGDGNTTATRVGADLASGPTASLQACLDACNLESKCAAVVISGASKNISAPVNGCSLRKGITYEGIFIRSVTRADINRLQFANLAIPGLTEPWFGLRLHLGACQVEGVIGYRRCNMTAVKKHAHAGAANVQRPLPDAVHAACRPSIMYNITMQTGHWSRDLRG